MTWLTLLGVFGLLDVALLAVGAFAATIGWMECRRFVHPEMAASTPSLPPSNWWIWMLTLAGLIGCPVSALVYYSVLEAQGAFPSYADSIAIPISAAAFTAVVTAPFVTAVTYVCTRRRRTRLRLLAWRSDRRVLSLAVTLLFTAPAGLMLFSLAQVWTDPRTQLVDHAFDPLVLVAVAWCLVLRASALQDDVTSLR